MDDKATVIKILMMAPEQGSKPDAQDPDARSPGKPIKGIMDHLMDLFGHGLKGMGEAGMEAAPKVNKKIIEPVRKKMFGE